MYVLVYVRWHIRECKYLKIAWTKRSVFYTAQWRRMKSYRWGGLI